MHIPLKLTTKEDTLWLTFLLTVWSSGRRCADQTSWYKGRQLRYFYFFRKVLHVCWNAGTWQGLLQSMNQSELGLHISLIVVAYFSAFIFECLHEFQLVHLQTACCSKLSKRANLMNNLADVSMPHHGWKSRFWIFVSLALSAVRICSDRYICVVVRLLLNLVGLWSLVSHSCRGQDAAE